MRYLLALFVLGHGIAHVVGFLPAWKLRDFPDMPYTTTLLNGAIDAGPAGTRIAGIVWLLLAVAFIVTAGVMLAGHGPLTATLRASALGDTAVIWILIACSTLMCVLGLPFARFGIVANAIIAALLLVALRVGF